MEKSKWVIIRIFVALVVYIVSMGVSLHVLAASQPTITRNFSSGWYVTNADDSIIASDLASEMRVFFQIDTFPPSVSMNSNVPTWTNTSPIPVAVTFSEPVTGFVATDIVPSNGMVSNFSGSGANYTFNLIPGGQGEVKADIPVGVAQDGSGNPNTAAVTFSRGYDSVAPDIYHIYNSPSANFAGWNDMPVEVHWQCFDNTSGVSSSSTLIQTITTEGNNLSATGTCIDNAGNAISNTEFGINIDWSIPGIELIYDPPLYTERWSKTNPTVITINATDNLSSVTSLNCSGYTLNDLSPLPAMRVTGKITLTGEGTHSIFCTAIDLAENWRHLSSVISIDVTPPTITYTGRTAPNFNGWNNTSVTVNWTCNDTYSGPVSSTVSQVVMTDGANQSITGTCTDNAGNKVSNTVSGINIDKTGPGFTIIPNRIADYNGWYNQPVSFSIENISDLSGLAGCSNIAEYDGPDEVNHSIFGQCSDILGNTATQSIQINYDATPPTNINGMLPVGGNGWYNQPVEITFHGTDALSGILTCDTVQYSGPNTKGTIVSGGCKDYAGNESAKFPSPLIKYDAIAPTVKVTLPIASSNGWYNTNVTLAVTGTDGLSEIDHCSADPVIIATEGIGQTSLGYCVDKAGNVVWSAPVSANIDKTPPAITFLGPVPDANGFTGPVTFRWLCSDPLSGVVARESNRTISSIGEGQMVTGTCKDMAGNSISNTVSGINIKKNDGSQAASNSGNAGSQNSIEAGEGTQVAEGSNTTEQASGLNFTYLYYILGGVVVVLLIGWLIFFLKKK
jgi:large repetitive protein